MVVEGKGIDSLTTLNEVLDEVDVTSGVIDVDGITRGGGREPPVRGEIVVLRVIITYLKFMNNPSRI